MIRRTPLLRFDRAREPFCANDLFLKLEFLQPTGSFKARGATNKLLTTPKEALASGVVTASGGNHGLAVARAAYVSGVAATIFVPSAVTAEKHQRLLSWGADVRVVGTVFDEANEAAQAFARERGAAFFHPFADPAVVAGQGTIGLEILEDLPDVDVIIIAIGGCGLMAGIATAVKALKPSVRLVGVEPEGSPTLHDSLAAGRVVRLPKVTTRVATMACGRTDDRVFDTVRPAVDHIALVSDEEMAAAARRLWDELGIAADLSGAAALAGLASNRIALRPGETVCALVCGAGSDIFR
nr:threonine/serine dehydratase [Ancylobacter lacus]